LDIFAYNSGNKIDKIMKKYDLKSSFSQLSDDIYIDQIIFIFGEDISEFVQESHCNSFVADIQ
jgi:hypothetical protein